MKSYQLAVDSKFYKHQLFVLILILSTSFSFSQSISVYKQTLMDTEAKLMEMKNDPLGLVPSIIDQLEEEPDNTYFKYDQMMVRDKDGNIVTEIGPDGKEIIKKVAIPEWRHYVKLNYFTQIMVIDGIEYNLYSMLNAHEVFYPGLFDEVLEKDVRSIRINHHYKLAIQSAIDKAIKKKRRALGYNDHDKITDENALRELNELEEKTRAAAILRVEDDLSKGKKRRVKYVPLTIAQKVEIRLCALLNQEHNKKSGRKINRTLCKKGHELNDFLKTEIKSYLEKRPEIRARARYFISNLPEYVQELNEDIEILNGRCKGIKKGYEELRDMDMTEFTKSVAEAGYPHPTKIVASYSGSNYSTTGTAQQQKSAGLAEIRNQKIQTYFDVQNEEIEGLLSLIKRHKIIYFYFSQKFNDAIGTFNHTACYEQGKGLNKVRVSDIKLAAREILYDQLHHQLIKFLGLYENLHAEQGKAYPNNAVVDKAMKKMIRLSPLSVSTVINKMHIEDAGVYLKTLSRLIFEMTKSKNNRDWWMGATKKIYSIGWMVGMALQFTMIPPLQALGQAINYVSYGVYGVNKILNAVDYAFTMQGLRYTQMAGTSDRIDIEVGLKLQDYYLQQSVMSWGELKTIVWELPLMLAGEGIINFAKVRKAFRPLMYNVDDLSTVEAFQLLDDLTLEYKNAHRVNKLKRPTLKKMAVILGDGAIPSVMKRNLEIWMTVDDITFEIIKKKLKRMKRMDLIKLKTKPFPAVEPFRSLLKGQVQNEIIEELVFKSFTPGLGLFKGLKDKANVIWENTVTAGKKVKRGAEEVRDKVTGKVREKVDDATEFVKEKKTAYGQAMKDMIIKRFGQKGWNRLGNGWFRFKDVVNNLYSWAFVKMHFFKRAVQLMEKYNYNGRFSGYFTMKYRDYLNEGVKRGYISWEEVKTIVNQKQVHEELRKLYLKYWYDDAGKLHKYVSIGTVNPAGRSLTINTFTRQFGKRARDFGLTGKEAKEIGQYLKRRLNRANLGEDELNVLVQKLDQFAVNIRGIDDARLLMDYIRDISRYPSWQKMSALNYIGRLFDQDVRNAFKNREDLSKLLPPIKYFKRNPVKDFYSRRSEYYEHRDWLYKRMMNDFSFRRSQNYPTKNKIKEIAYNRARSVQEMKLGCAARTGSIFRSYAKSSYKGFSMNSGLWITAIGYGFQNYMKDKNAEFFFRFIYDMLMTAFGKYLKNAVMMNTNNTMWGKARSTNMIMALKDVPDAWLNVNSVKWVRLYIDKTIENPVPEDILKDEDFQHGIYAIHDALVHNYLESDEKIQELFEKLSKATNMNEIMYALYAEEGKETNVPEADLEIFKEIEKYNSGGGDFQQDIFVLLEDLEYKSRMELKEYGVNSGSAGVDRYIAHRAYGVPMAFFSYGLSQGIYYNLCWGIKNPGAAYVTSLIGYYSIASLRSNFYYWWMNETQITQPASKKEDSDE